MVWTLYFFNLYTSSFFSISDVTSGYLVSASLQFYSDLFETLQVFRTWYGNVHVFQALASHFFFQTVNSVIFRHCNLIPIYIVRHLRVQLLLQLYTNLFRTLLHVFYSMEMCMWFRRDPYFCVIVILCNL